MLRSRFSLHSGSLLGLIFCSCLCRGHQTRQELKDSKEEEEVPSEQTNARESEKAEADQQESDEEEKPKENQEEEIDIDLNDPATEEAATKIQVGKIAKIFFINCPQLCYYKYCNGYFRLPSEDTKCAQKWVKGLSRNT